MDYNTLALLTYQLKKQTEPKKIAELEQQLRKTVETFADMDPANLYNTYEHNASFASKMSMVLQESATKVYSHAVMEKNTADVEHHIGRSFNLVADAVIWDEIATEFFSLLEEAQEAAMEEDEEGLDTDEE